MSQHIGFWNSVSGVRLRVRVTWRFMNIAISRVVSMVAEPHLGHL